MELYHKSSFDISRIITHNYSTSFSLGIMAFAPKYREPIYSIYGFVRLADEIVDTFHDYDKRKLLEQLRSEVFKAIEEGISTNPVIHSFLLTVKKFNIEHSHIHAFLDSMEMDLYNNYYEEKNYDEYIYGSAEVVGLMCLKVFVEGNQQQYNELLEPAKALGSAFQKVNFLRDIKSDIEERGRIYLPGINRTVSINDFSKKELEKEIEKEFAQALEGIKNLPAGVRLGVYSAYLYYVKLFHKIQKADVKKLLSKRVRVSNPHKLMLLLKSIIEVKVLKTC
ncbi:MAG TPA: phytoene/squalene synthase family protein [Ignavibacteriaceae bacterium]|nr:phytoene/squalene synthase family protein [Ignavibacteriaceae bacterium]